MITISNNPSSRPNRNSTNHVEHLDKCIIPLKNVKALDSRHYLLAGSKIKKSCTTYENETSIFERIVSESVSLDATCVPYFWVFSKSNSKPVSVTTDQAGVNWDYHVKWSGFTRKQQSKLQELINPNGSLLIRNIHYVRNYIDRLSKKNCPDRDKQSSYQILVGAFDSFMQDKPLDVDRFSAIFETMVNIVMDDLFSLNAGEKPMMLHQVWLGNQPPPLEGRNIIAGMAVDPDYKNIKIHLWGDIGKCGFLFEADAKTNKKVRKKYQNIVFHDINQDLSEDHFSTRNEKCLVYAIHSILKLNDRKSNSSAADITRTLLTNYDMRPVQNDPNDNLSWSFAKSSKGGAKKNLSCSAYLDFGKLPLTRIESMKKLIPLSQQKGFIETYSAGSACWAMSAFPGVFDEAHSWSLYLHAIIGHDQEMLIRNIVDIAKIELENPAFFDPEKTSWDFTNFAIRYLLMGGVIDDIKAIHPSTLAMEELLNTRCLKIEADIHHKNKEFNRLSIGDLKERIDSFVLFRSKLLNLSKSNYLELESSALNEFIESHLSSLGYGCGEKVFSKISNIASDLLVNVFCTQQEKKSSVASITSQFKASTQNSYQSYAPDAEKNISQEKTGSFIKIQRNELPRTFREKQVAFLQLASHLGPMMTRYVKKRNNRYMPYRKNGVDHKQGFSKPELISQSSERITASSDVFDRFDYASFYTRAESGEYKKLSGRDIKHLGEADYKQQAFFLMHDQYYQKKPYLVAQEQLTFCPDKKA